MRGFSSKTGALASILLIAVAVTFSSCTDPGGGSDAGDTDPGTLGVELGKRTDQPEFASITQPGTDLELISGFQGGYHLEPALRIAHPGPDEFITVVDYAVVDTDTGESLEEEPGLYRVDQRAWTRADDGLVRLWERVILAIDEPADAAGRRVRIEVDVDVEGGLGHGSDTLVVDIINEVDELRQ